ncbi:MAG TPA: hypothetical protein VJS15_00650, partial [Allosphingosinicella sp.]|nr:hypothetical protein [Allosphingosinicella sp.]
MPAVRGFVVFAALLCAGLAGTAQAQPERPQPGLTAFSTDTTLRAFLREIIAQERAENMAEYGSEYPPPPP